MYLQVCIILYTHIRTHMQACKRTGHNLPIHMTHMRINTCVRTYVGVRRLVRRHVRTYVRTYICTCIHLNMHLALINLRGCKYLGLPPCRLRLLGSRSRAILPKTKYKYRKALKMSSPPRSSLLLQVEGEVSIGCAAAREASVKT